MRIVCMGSVPAKREELYQAIESLVRAHSLAINYAEPIEVLSTTPEELSVNSAPDIICVSVSSDVEPGFSLCASLRKEYKGTPLILFLADEAYTLRNLKRFSPQVDCVLREEHPEVGVVHTLCEYLDKANAPDANGMVISVRGVKGGVGTTSLVSGLARAFDETGRSVIVVDLSRNSPFPIYMACPRWQSTEYASLLTEGLVPERSLLDRWIVEAPNGVHVFLPPAGGADVRDLWLRSEEQFESSLTVIEFLKERYDIVLVDCGQAEGLLHFALQAQSAFRVLVTSNEPASVHMLHSEIGALKDVPGDGALKLVVNETTDHALSRGDVESFLELIEQYEDEMLLSYIAHDKRAWRWVGTGNTFYDESKKATRRELLNLAKCFIGSTEEEDASGEDLQTQPKRLGWVKESSEANASSQKTGGIISLPLLRSREPEQQEAVEEESSEPIIMEAPEVVKAQPTKPKLLRPKVTNSDLAGRPAQISAERAASQKSDSNEYQKPQLVSE